MSGFLAMTTAEIQAELGRRLRRARLDANVRQAELARRAGLSVRTLRSIEAGADTQLSSLIRVLRALDRVEALDALLPEPTVSPMELLRRAGKRRQRASRTDG
ncbi:MAG: helix-turn-helix domain-containing protein [Planctomycetota bacterium]